MRSVRERGRELNAGLHSLIPAPPPELKMPLGGDIQQLLQLCKKNFIVKARNRRATILELAFSLYFLFIIIFLIKFAYSRQLSSYSALPTLPLTSPSPLGTTSQLALPLTCLYSQSATACASRAAQVPSWYQHFQP